MLEVSFSDKLIEAGCDEAGRGCIAGPVFAAAVILPKDFSNELLNDSKKLKASDRDKLRTIIEKEALAWSVASVDNNIIDEINILNASFLAMHLAIDKLETKPELLLIDGNRFKPYKNIPYQCVIKGDGKYMSIAAASILAKTHRDEFMMNAHEQYPDYNWKQNKGYPTRAHKKVVLTNGITTLHRKTFNMSEQLKLDF